jgi:nucleotide-binding universal stress UspA family protein
MKAMDAKTRISLKNILYPTDFSPAAEAAIPYVTGLAKRYEAKIHALHVRGPAAGPIVGPEAMPQVLEVTQHQAELEASELHDIFSGLPHEVFVSEGDVWTTINTIITQENIDLIVIGTRGRTGVKRALLGSVAEEIFRKAPCPVLTVGPHVLGDPERQLEMKEILFATDFSPESLAAVPYAVSLAQEHQAHLTLLHVIPKHEVGDLVHAEQHVDSIRRQLQKLVPPEAESWCEPKFVVEQGPAPDKILDTAVASGADLIVLGVRNVGDNIGATTHLFRPTAHRVVTHAGCPVLTVRG